MGVSRPLGNAAIGAACFGLVLAATGCSKPQYECNMEGYWVIPPDAPERDRSRMLSENIELSLKRSGRALNLPEAGYLTPESLEQVSGCKK